MHKTRRGRIVVGAALLLFVLAYAFATVAPAILGLLVLGYAAYSRARFQALLAEAHFEAERTPPVETPHQDEPLRLASKLLVGPPGLRVTIADPGTTDVVVEQTTVKPLKLNPTGVTFSVDTVVRPKRRGSHRLRTLEVLVEDPDGLFQHAFKVEAPIEFTAHAPRAAFKRGQAMRQLQAMVNPRRTDPGEWSDEVLSHRPYLPADQLRAVDWKASSRMQQLLTRTFIKEVERPLILMLDASRTMRYRGPRLSMLDHGAELLSVFVGSAVRQGVNTGFGAFDEYRTLQLIKPGKDQKLPRQVSQALAALPDPIEIPERGLRPRRRAAAHEEDADEDEVSAGGNGDGPVAPGNGRPTFRLATAPDEEPDPAEAPRRGARDEPSAFERAIAPFLGGKYATRIPHGMTKTMRAAAPDNAPSSIVLFSDLAHGTDQAIAAIARARQHQHNVVLVAPFWPWYHLRPKDVDAETLEAIYAEFEERQHTLRRLEALGVAVVDMAPGTSGQDILVAHGRASR